MERWRVIDGEIEMESQTDREGERWRDRDGVREGRELCRVCRSNDGAECLCSLCYQAIHQKISMIHRMDLTC